jgi:predicted RNA-binding protein with PIN domain
MPERFLIDGTNLIRGNPSLDKLERLEGSHASRERLIELVKAMANRGEERFWLIVFDGPGDVDAERRDRVDVRYSGGQTADELIMEAARNALAVGAKATIVSSDNELTIDGAQTIKSQDFYDELVSFAKAPPKEDDSTQKALRIIEYLIEKGDLPSGALKDSNRIRDLAQHLDYYSQGEISSQKLAKKVEGIARKTGILGDAPDPQKIIYRNLKEYFDRKKP